MIGRWAFGVESPLPLSGAIAGTLDVAPGGHPGPLAVSAANRRRFAYADGTPCLVMGFECDWLFALDADNAEDIPNTRLMAETIVANGFNHVVMNVFAYDAPWGEKDRIPPEFLWNKPAAFPFGGTNDEPNHATLNLTFFQRLDRVIAHLDARGLTAHVMLYVWNKLVNWPAPASAEDDRYLDHVVRRYAAFPNVVWDISKEALLYGQGDPAYVVGRIERLRQQSPQRRLVTVHDWDFCQLRPETVDFASIQEWTHGLHDRLLRVAEAVPEMPVLCIEHGGYERHTPYSVFDGAYSDAVTCLDRFWQCLFAGVYAAHYWQGAAWYHAVPDPIALPPAHRPRLDWYRHVVSILGRVPFETLHPEQQPFCPPMLTDGKRHWLFLITGTRNGVCGTSDGIGGGMFRVTWLDAQTGESVTTPHEMPGKWLGIKRPNEFAAPVAVVHLERAD
jgi:hypothetical protein